MFCNQYRTDPITFHATEEQRKTFPKQWKFILRAQTEPQELKEEEEEKKQTKQTKPRMRIKSIIAVRSSSIHGYCFMVDPVSEVGFLFGCGAQVLAFLLRELLVSDRFQDPAGLADLLSSWYEHDRYIEWTQETMDGFFNGKWDLETTSVILTHLTVNAMYFQDAECQNHSVMPLKSWFRSFLSVSMEKRYERLHAWFGFNWKRLLYSIRISLENLRAPRLDVHSSSSLSSLSSYPTNLSCLSLETRQHVFGSYLKEDSAPLSVLGLSLLDDVQKPLFSTRDWVTMDLHHHQNETLETIQELGPVKGLSALCHTGVVHVNYQARHFAALWTCLLRLQYRDDYRKRDKHKDEKNKANEENKIGVISVTPELLRLFNHWEAMTWFPWMYQNGFEFPPQCANLSPRWSEWCNYEYVLCQFAKDPSRKLIHVETRLQNAIQMLPFLLPMDYSSFTLEYEKNNRLKLVGFCANKQPVHFIFTDRDQYSALFCFVFEPFATCISFD